jgi:hypothetical protein
MGRRLLRLESSSSFSERGSSSGGQGLRHSSYARCSGCDHLEVWGEADEQLEHAGQCVFSSFSFFAFSALIPVLADATASLPQTRCTGTSPTSSQHERSSLNDPVRPLLPCPSSPFSLSQALLTFPHSFTGRSTPAPVLAKSIVSRSLRSSPPTFYTGGSQSWLFYFLDRLPRPLVWWLLARVLGTTLVGKGTTAEKKKDL